MIPALISQGILAGGIKLSDFGKKIILFVTLTHIYIYITNALEKMCPAIQEPSGFPKPLMHITLFTSLLIFSAFR